MLNTSALPADVLCEILDAVYNQIAPSLELSYYSKLAAFQPITSVCRLWRALSLPIFYKTIIFEQHIHCDNPPDSDCVEPDQSISTRTRHNIELAISGGYMRFAKSLWTGVYKNNLSVAEDTRLYEIQGLLERCNLRSVEWPNITQIVYCGPSRIDSLHGYTGDRTAAFKALAKSLPNVDSFLCHSLVDSAKCAVPLSALINAFSTSLKWIHINSEGCIGALLSQTVAHFPRTLTHLHLNFDHPFFRIEDGGEEPSPLKIYAPALQYLYINLDPAHFGWCLFYDDLGDSTHTEFTSLKVLRVGIISDESFPAGIRESEFGRAMRRCRFPALEDLSLYNQQYDDLGLMSLFDLPSTPLKSLHLNNYDFVNGSNINELDTAMLARLESLTLEIGELADPSELSSLMVRLRSGMRKIKRVAFRIGARPYLALPLETMHWESLQSFSITSCVDIGAVPRLISSLRGLKVFELNLCNTGRLESERSGKQGDAGTGGYQRAISNSLLEFGVTVAMEDKSSCEVVEMYSEIVLAIPSLRRIVVPDQHLGGIVSWIGKYSGARRFVPVLRDLEVIPRAFLDASIVVNSPCCPFD